MWEDGDMPLRVVSILLWVRYGQRLRERGYSLAQFELEIARRSKRAADPAPGTPAARDLFDRRDLRARW
jgi:hypothetical protein